MKKLFVIPILLILISCKDKPMHTVNYEQDMMIIYSATKVDGEYGDYQYFVRDNSTKGWTLNSDDKYNVGDTLIFKKK